jgi:hypothetical protein
MTRKGHKEKLLFSFQLITLLSGPLVVSPASLFIDKCNGYSMPWTPTASSFDYESSSHLLVGIGSKMDKFGVQMAGLGSRYWPDYHH